MNEIINLKWEDKKRILKENNFIQDEGRYYNLKTHIPYGILELKAMNEIEFMKIFSSK